MEYRENILTYEDYCRLRQSVGWTNFSPTQAQNALLKFVDGHTPAGGRSSILLIAEKGKEPFYESLGFKQIPHEFCGSGMRRVIYKP